MTTKTYVRRLKLGTYQYLTDLCNSPASISQREVYYFSAVTGANVTDTFTGVDNPSWRSQVASHVNATTPASGRIARLKHLRMGSIESQGYFTCFSLPVNHAELIRRAAYGPLFTLTGDELPTSLSAIPASTNSLALARFYKAYRKQQTSFEGLVAAGEFMETLRMLRNPFRVLVGGIWKYLSAAKKLKKVPLRRRANALADTWLEYSFGWKPLMSDAEHAMLALNRLQQHEQGVVRPIRGVAIVATQVANSSSYQAVESNWTAFIQNRVQTRKDIVRYKGAVWVRPHLAYQIDSRIVGFDLGSVLPSLYELIPWSFLLDYVSNVGDIITAFSTHLTDLAWVCKTERSSLITRFSGRTGKDVNPQPSGSDYISGWQSSGDPGSMTLELTTFSRTIPYMGVPSLVLSIPGFGTKWLNMAALITRSKHLSDFLSR